MKQEDMIKALAELDGWVQTLEPQHHIHRNTKWMGRKSGGDWMILPDYLTSYDAILSLVQKLHGDDGTLAHNEIFEELSKICAPCECGQHWAIWMIRFSPAQLCEALLKATNRWQE